MSATHLPSAKTDYHWPEPDLLTQLSQLRAEVRTLTQLLAEHVKDVARVPTTPSLEDMGDVLTLADLARLVGRKPRYFESWITLERKTGETLLPPAIEGLPGRYRKTDVAKWLKAGAGARIHARTLRELNSTRKSI